MRLVIMLRHAFIIAALALATGCGAAPTGQTASGGSTQASTLPPAAPAATSSAPATSGAAQTGAVPACANATASIERPAAFPAAFPLPPGTVIVSQETRSGERLIINTVVPGLDTKGVAEFFERELPKAGFTVTSGESEPDEAEANYSGNGIQGRWKVNNITGCAGAVTLQVLAGKG